MVRALAPAAHMQRTHAGALMQKASMGAFAGSRAATASSPALQVPA